MLAFDYRFGLFVSSPIMLFAFSTPFLDRGSEKRLPKMELIFLLGIFVAFWLFFSGSNYTRLQFNTGIRYLAAVFPFLFVPVAVALARLPRRAVYLVSIISVAEAWSLAMYRDVEKPLGVLDPVLRFFLGGFQLPALATVSRMGDQSGSLIPNGASALPLLLLAGVVILAIWLPGANSTA
jgi:hypothetical protein